MNAELLAKKIDHTLLKPTASEADFRRLYRQALAYNFRAVCINETALDRMDARTRKRLKEKGILIACVLDFPIGQGGYINKHFGATLAREKGADELDVVWNLGAFLEGNVREVLRELKPVANALPTKVIIEAGQIINAGYGKRRTNALLREAARVVRESGAFCIKDHTGFSNSVPVEGGREYIRLWKEVEPGLLVKSAAGIRSFEDAKILIDAGADILGTSAGHIIVEEVIGSAES